MAAPANKKCRAFHHKTEENLVEQLRTQVNNLTAALRIVTAKLDLDATVTDVNYFALSMDAAIATAPAIIDTQT